MDMKLGNFILPKMVPPQKLVLAPGTIFIGNTVIAFRCDYEMVHCIRTSLLTQP